MNTPADSERIQRLQEDVRRRQLARQIQFQRDDAVREQRENRELLGPAGVLLDPKAGSIRKAFAVHRIIGDPALRPEQKLIHDLGLQALTGTAGLIAGGVAALPVAGKDPEAAKRILDRVQDSITVQPFYQEGREFNEALAPALDWVKNKAQDLIFAASGGNPVVATVAQTALEGTATVAGLRQGRINTRSVRLARAQMENAARELGINLDARNLPEEFINAAGELSGQRRGDMLDVGPGGIDANGNPVPATQRTLRQIKEYERQRVRWAYDMARSTDGQVYARSMEELMDRIKYQINERGFDLDFSPQAKKRLADLDALVQRDSTAQKTLHASGTVDPEMAISQAVSPMAKDRMIELNTLDDIRKRLVRDREHPEYALHETIRNELDDWIVRQYDAAHFKGDPAAITAWQNARGMNQRYQFLFKDNRFIRNIIEQEATPGMLRNWMLGASGMNESKAIVIRRLKDILGESSPQFENIRKDFLFDIVRPLTREKPNFSEFLERVERMHDKAPGVVDELGVDVATNLEDLRTFVRAADNAKISPEFNIDMDRLVVRLLAGHQIAKAGARMQLLTAMLKSLRGSGPSARAQIERQILGPDIDKPFMPPGSVAHQAFIADVFGTTPEEQEASGGGR